MSLSRRDLLLASAATALASMVPAAAAPVSPTDRAAQLAGTPEVDLNFAAQSYAWPGGTAADAVAAGLLTVSRNAPAWAEATSGAWQQFAANVLRVTDRGALIERGAVNYAQNGNLGTGAALPPGWWIIGLPTTTQMTIGAPITDARTGLRALPVSFSGSNNLSYTTRVELHFAPRPGVATKQGDIWLGSVFAAWQSGTRPSNARLVVQAMNAAGNVQTGGLVGGTPAALGTDPTADMPIPAGQTTLQRVETNTFTVANANGVRLQIALAFEIAVGAVVNFTILLAMPQLEPVPDVEARATSPITNFDSTGIGTQRPADLVAFSNTLLARLQAGQATLAATLNGWAWRPAYGTSNAQRRQLSAVVPRRPQAILGINGQAGLLREADGGVSSALGGRPRTFRAQITNWANPHTAILTWGGGKLGVCSSACGNFNYPSGAAPSPASVTLGSAGGSFLDGYLRRLVTRSAAVADLAAIGGVDADIIVYGAKPGGITAAVRAASEGRKVAILGDWREVQVGGMMTGGLGQTDIVNQSTYGGLSRYIITRINQLMGPNNTSSAVNDTNFSFQPRFASAAFDEFLARAGVDVYWTTGISSVAKSGTRLTRLICATSKNYGTQALTRKSATAKVFIGADYEGDIMPLAGISWTMGREASATYKESNAGYLGNGTWWASVNNFMFPDSAGTAYVLDIDPWVVPGNTASGLIKGVTPPPNLAVGDADPTGTQAYTFRATLTRTAERRIALPAKPPTGFDAAEFEIVLRFLAALTASGRTYQAGTGMVASTGNKVYNIFDLLTLNPLSEVFDVNNRIGVSSDYVGKSAAYVSANYATREQIWQAHATWFLGLWYVMQYHNDPRVPAALRADALTFGLDILHYGRDFHPNDLQYWSPQLYVREARRMRGGFVWNGTDIVADDGTTPRSPRSIAAGSYAIDSHHFYRLPVQVPGSTRWRTWNEGGVVFFAGGTVSMNGKSGMVAGKDKMAPLPLDAFLPQQSECSNYLATFAVSCSHLAFGFFRMELASAAAGEGVGVAAAMACEASSQPDLQVLLQPGAAAPFNYGTLRSRLLNSPAIALGGIPPYAPLVN